jgi:hypothetical protein
MSDENPIAAGEAMKLLSISLFLQSPIFAKSTDSCRKYSLSKLSGSMDKI